MTCLYIKVRSFFRSRCLKHIVDLPNNNFLNLENLSLFSHKEVSNDRRRMGIGSHRTEKVPKKSYLIVERSELRPLKRFHYRYFENVFFFVNISKIETQRSVEVRDAA